VRAALSAVTLQTLAFTLSAATRRRRQFDASLDLTTGRAVSDSEA
jgi:hypothetical protein